MMGINLFILIAILYLVTFSVSLDSIGTIFQTQWERFLGFVGSDPFTHYVYGTYMLSNLVYFGVGKKSINANYDSNESISLAVTN